MNADTNLPFLIGAVLSFVLTICLAEQVDDLNESMVG